MAKMDPNQNAYYPSRTKVGDLHDDFRLLFDHVYKLQEQVKTMQSSTGQASQGETANGPSNTKINGLFVKGTPPANGDTIRYNSKTGQFEFGA